MFGLSLEKMNKSWTEVKNPDHPRHYYKTLSTEQNCSGMTLSLLRAGGADLYHSINPTLVTRQSDLESYSLTLTNQMDYFNYYADILTARFDQYNVPDEAVMSVSEICGKLKSIGQRYTIPKDWKQKLSEINSIIRTYEKTEPTLAELTPVAKQLTIAVNEAFWLMRDHTRMIERLEPALHAFQQIKTAMKQAYDREHSPSSTEEPKA